MPKSGLDDLRLSARQGIGKRLRYAREVLGLTQRQIAVSLGLTPLSVLQYEAGRTPFPTDLLPALDALGIDSSWVVSGIPCMENRATREQFVAISTWVKRELAIHELSITPTQEFELAWHVLRRLGTPSMRNVVEREQEIITTVRELLTTVAESLP